MLQSVISELWDVSLPTKIVGLLFVGNLLFLVLLLNVLTVMHNHKKKDADGVSLLTVLDLLLLPMLAIAYGIEQRSIIFALGVFAFGLIAYLCCFGLLGIILRLCNVAQ